MIKLNEVFLSRMKNILGDEFDDFLASLERSSEKAIFVNKKITTENLKQIADFKMEQIPYERNGFYVENLSGKHFLHQAGAFYMQEPSAMFTVNCFQFKGDEKVLDMCAAPGGKSIQIANRIPNGVLVSNEINKQRSQILYSNIERMGLSNVIITNDTPERIGNAYGNTFDVCLVDAPCSGEGMFRKGEIAINEWNDGLNELCAKRQIEILSCADKTLKTGGFLIYSTCTYSKQENEDVVSEFCKNFGYSLVEIKYPFTRGIGMKEAVRLYPYKVKGEGQFVALLKKESENCCFAFKNLKLNTSKMAINFLKQQTNLSFDEKRVLASNELSFLVPDVDLIKAKVNYVCAGVKLGETKDNRFIPSHFLFSAFGDNFNLKINLDYKNLDVAKFLHGETFNVDLLDGYGALMVNGCSLGGFKISQNKFKNHYPKGLRL